MDQATDYSASLSTRYREAYIHARALNGIGIAIRVVGLILGAAILLLAVQIALHNKPAVSLFTVITGAIGVAVFLVAYVASVLVSSQAQIVKASLDCAVNSSPLLTDEQKAEVMSL